MGEDVDDVTDDESKEKGEIDDAHRFLDFRREIRIDLHVFVEKKDLDVVGDEESRIERHRQYVRWISLLQ